jgi:hypothetical protein
MGRNMLETWIGRALILILLIAFHWLAVRVGKSRSRATRQTHRGGRRDAVSSDGVMLTNEPLEPR